jgi:hypothetical protein
VASELEAVAILEPCQMRRTKTNIRPDQTLGMGKPFHSVGRHHICSLRLTDNFNPKQFQSRIQHIQLCQVIQVHQAIPAVPPERSTFLDITAKTALTFIPTLDALGADSWYAR